MSFNIHHQNGLNAVHANFLYHDLPQRVVKKQLDSTARLLVAVGLALFNRTDAFRVQELEHEVA